MPSPRSPLAGLRVIESALLGPGLITTHLADLGAHVIKVESPEGDYIREMTWPIVNGVSLLHLHVHRGKQSITLDLRKPEGVAVYRDLVKGADVVVEAMRPGSLSRRGLGYDDLRATNPKLVFCNISGYGMTGPYQNLPAHGIAFDTWGGIVSAAQDDEGFCYIPEHASMGMHTGPMFGALGILAAVLRARETGQGSLLEIFRTRSCAEWVRLGDEQNFPIAPCNTPKTIVDDPQFQDRFPWYGKEKHGVDMMPFPVKFIGEELPEPCMAPTVGEHTDAVCRA